MKKRIILSSFWIAILAMLIIPFNAFAATEQPLAPGEGTEVATADKEDEEGPTASADVAFLSQYIWRGMELSRDSLVIQPSATIGYKGFSFNLWGNLDTSPYSAGGDNNQAKWNETDMTVGYDTSFGPVGVGVGYIYYALDSLNDTQEFYLSGGVDVILAPTLTIYWDVDENPGWYFNLGISHSFELPRDITFDLAASVGYLASHSYDNIDNAGNPTNDKFSNFQDGLVSAGFTIPFLKYFTATPMLAYSFPLGNAADN